MVVGLFFVHINVKIMGVSESDSAFGTGYLAHEEKRAMMATMQKVTEQIMSRTQNMTAFDSNDSYVIGLAERQMRANAYEAHDGHGQDYRAERWFFLDKDGKAIFKTIEFPLP